MLYPIFRSKCERHSSACLLQADVSVSDNQYMGLGCWRHIIVAAVVMNCAACAPTIVYENPLPERVESQHESPPANGAIYQEGSHRLLFEDLKAKRQGDLITVILDERTNAAKNASTSASRSTGVDISAPQLLGKTATLNGNPAGIGLTSGSDFSGSGDSSQSNSLFGNITARVVYVEPNGNLHIKGEKQLTLNSGLEIISVKGVVRPTDLTPDNTILSTLIAEADIVYSGKGLIADNNRAGWLTRVFTSVFWPF